MKLLHIRYIAKNFSQRDWIFSYTNLLELYHSKTSLIMYSQKIKIWTLVSIWKWFYPYSKTHNQKRLFCKMQTILSTRSTPSYSNNSHSRLCKEFYSDSDFVSCAKDSWILIYTMTSRMCQLLLKTIITRQCITCQMMKMKTMMILILEVAQVKAVGISIIHITTTILRKN